MQIKFLNNLLQDAFQLESNNIDKISTKDLASMNQFKNSLLMYSNKTQGVSFTARINKEDKKFKQIKVNSTNSSKIQSNKRMTFKDEVILIPSQALKYGHFVIPDKQIQYVETPASKQTQNWTKPTSKKSVEHSPLTGNSQFSMVTDSWGRPPTALKKSTVAYHSKNSMSTHIKKNSYFNSKTDDLQDDLDEFPQQPQERKRMTDSKQVKQSEEDSSVFKYKEYKKYISTMQRRKTTKSNRNTFQSETTNRESTKIRKRKASILSALETQLRSSSMCSQTKLMLLWITKNRRMQMLLTRSWTNTWKQERRLQLKWMQFEIMKVLRSLEVCYLSNKMRVSVTNEGQILLPEMIVTKWWNWNLSMKLNTQMKKTNTEIQDCMESLRKHC